MITYRQVWVHRFDEMLTVIAKAACGDETLVMVEVGVTEVIFRLDTSMFWAACREIGHNEACSTTLNGMHAQLAAPQSTPHCTSRSASFDMNQY